MDGISFSLLYIAWNVALKNNYDYVIVGAGILGLTIAYELLEKNNALRIAIFEKERDVALHASGLNSGVIHSGIYYGQDSFKAKFCLIGNEKLRAFCQDNRIDINSCGKLIVSKDASELARLEKLYENGLKNGAMLSLLDVKEMREIEPHAKTYERAIWSPNTASVMPKSVCKALQNILSSKGVIFYFGTKITQVDVTAKQLRSRQGDTYSFANLINCAGLYADKIAEYYGLSDNYLMMPFKGLYLVSQSPQISLKTNVYPVPNEAHPFLGVHFTITGDGKTKVGPTALPAFWREQYQPFGRFSYQEFSQIVRWYYKSYRYNHFNFRQLLSNEAKYVFKQNMLNEASRMVNLRLSKSVFKYTNPGIRAQLYDKQSNQLVTDFVFKKKKNSLHILNAVSPAFTSSFAIANYLIKEYLND
ncbi:MAG: L-2-hydroxyglutarate oxidase [Legionellaceae bacterium]|nr:L-2-hydroxyglutarate oxidase [Legionellaceae bacterium]